jgi:hypothetical protein
MDIDMQEKTNCCSKNVEDTKQVPETTVNEIDFLLNKENQSQSRFSICQECDQLLPIVNMCKQCGCLMNIKTRIYSSKCPLEKW